jgi:hypothetical protein
MNERINKQALESLQDFDVPLVPKLTHIEIFDCPTLLSSPTLCQIMPD